MLQIRQETAPWLLGSSPEWGPAPEALAAFPPAPAHMTSSSAQHSDMQKNYRAAAPAQHCSAGTNAHAESPRRGAPGASLTADADDGTPGPWRSGRVITMLEVHTWTGATAPTRMPCLLIKRLGGEEFHLHSRVGAGHGADDGDLTFESVPKQMYIQVMQGCVPVRWRWPRPWW